jgi:Domain of unknown function (DUF5979)/Thioester domain
MGRMGVVGRLLRRGWRVPMLLVLALGVLLLQAAAAGAVVGVRASPSRPTVRANTQMIVEGWTPGQSVTGFIATASSAFNPVTDPYPASDTPPDGFVSKDEGYAGLIQGRPAAGGATLNVYCIDINTDTTVNIGYVLGTWDESGVPNVGYIERILDEYFPHTSEPTTLADGTPATPAQTAAAVQAAIWFFSDRYVLSTADPLHDTVVEIVNRIKSEGALPAPTPPSLDLTPSSLSHSGVVGPFTVHTNQPSATVTATGGTMYKTSTAAPGDLLGDGTTATVSDGQEIWLRSTGPPFTAVLQATATAEVPSGNVWLYDGNTPGWSDAQRLILAETTTLTTTVQATAEFQVGSLIVKKTIAGPAAGKQGKVVIKVLCDDGVTRKPFEIPAGAKGTKAREYKDIDAGTQCEVRETVNGTNRIVIAEVRGNGQEVGIPVGGTKTVQIKDLYRFVPGSLIVKKTIAGPGAGKQGPVTIHTVCNHKALVPDFKIPGGVAQGEYTHQYDDIPVPATCTVTETVDGHNSTVSVDVEGSGQTVKIPPARIKEAVISDTYGLLPGQLEVTKTIDGPAAGKQGPVTIKTVCGGTTLPLFQIPAGATDVQPQIYSGLPAGTKCTVTETVDGHTSTVSVVVAGSPHTTTIPAGGSAAVNITDTYGFAPGSLLVTKNIAGPSAGHQGPVTIGVVCDGVAQPDFVIGAGTGAGTVTHSFDDIPAGSVCTVTETTDGSTATVIVDITGNGQSVTIPAGTVVPVSLMDVYDEGSPSEGGDVVPGPPTVEATGSLTVIKHITGPAARHHGRIAILVTCGGPVEDFVFEIPAGTGPGSVTRRFNNIPAGVRCAVTETADGHTNAVAVVASGGRTVTIPATGSATVRLTDSFTVRPPTPTVTG